MTISFIVFTLLLVTNLILLLFINREADRAANNYEKVIKVLKQDEEILNQYKQVLDAIEQHTPQL